MTRDDTIRWARQCNLIYKEDDEQFIDFLHAFAALVTAAEREACAQVCDQQAERSEASMLKSKGIKARDIYSAAGQTARWNAAAIRARSQA